MNFYSLTDVGMVRSANQDAFWTGDLSKEVSLCLVCDGMGGAKAGNIASQTAIQLITDYVKRSFHKHLNAQASVELLKNAIESANIGLYDLSRRSPDYEGMGTTVVAVLIGSDFLAVAHVGDSRAYLSGPTLMQLTRDHSMVQSLVESGKLTPEEAEVHPRKNVITRALGTEEEVLVDCAIFDRVAGERLLLCSDGLSNFVDSEKLQQLLQSENLEETPKTLIEQANQNGGSDNITAVVALL